MRPNDAVVRTRIMTNKPIFTLTCERQMHELFLSFEYTCYLIMASAICNFWNLDYFWICLIILIFRSIIYDEEQYPERISIKIQLYRTGTNFVISFVAAIFYWLFARIASSTLHSTDIQSEKSTSKYQITIGHMFAEVVSILYWYFLLLTVFSVIRTILNLIHLVVKIVYEIQLHLYDSE